MRETTCQVADPPACNGALQNEPFGPVTGIRELVVRVTRIHPGLAVPRIVVGKRKMRTSVAERFADGDPFGVECVRHAAYGRLCSFLVNVPLVEMLDGPAFMVINGGWMIGPAFISAAESASPQPRSRSEKRVRSRRVHALRDVTETRRSATARLCRKCELRKGPACAQATEASQSPPLRSPHGCPHPARRWRRCRSRMCREAGTRPARRANAARRDWRYQAARRQAPDTGRDRLLRSRPQWRA